MYITSFNSLTHYTPIVIFMSTIILTFTYPIKWEFVGIDNELIQGIAEYYLRDRIGH